jgi:hypothetical protein
MPTGLFIPATLVVGTILICCWRIAVGAIAARPVTDRVRQAAGLAGPPVPRDPRAADFGVLEGLCTAAGALASTGRGTALIRAYYVAVQTIGGLLPALAPWSDREMTVCSRYLAARVDRYLASNDACSRRVRSL